MRYDSNYSILKAILTLIDGSESNVRYDSCYSILVAILDKIGTGGSGIAAVLPASIDEATMAATLYEDSFDEDTMTVTITNVEI